MTFISARITVPIAGMALLALAAGACAPRSYRPPSDDVVYRQEGVASWYGTKFHGRKTANGERYNMHALTAAHRTLPLGTIVRVTHLGSGRKVVVRINDRGPFVKGRIIDLSYGAAQRLGMAKEGVASVLVEAFAGSPGAAHPGSAQYFTVQAGSFQVRKRALALKRDLAGDYDGVNVVPYRHGSTIFYRVRIGRYAARDRAESVARSLEREGYDSFVVSGH